MARRPTQSMPEDRFLTVADMRSGIERLKQRFNELQALDPQSIQTYRSEEIVSCETAIESTLAAVLGQGTPKFKQYKSASDLEPPAIYELVPEWVAMRSGGVSEPRINIHALQDGITQRKRQSTALLGQAIRDLEEEIRYRPREPMVESEDAQSQQALTSHKVFLVHGRDDVAKNEVALFLRAIGLEPIILHLQPNGGRHLLTKFTEESEGARFAVVLMTPDDEGGLTGTADKIPRARQNVVFELGFFIGKLGPANVAALVKGEVEKPSDFDGIAYIAFHPGGRWKTELARELHYAKVPFDPAKALTA